MDSWRIIKGTELFRINRKSVELRKSALPAVSLHSPKHKGEGTPRRATAGRRLGSVTLRRRSENHSTKRSNLPKEIYLSHEKISVWKTSPARGALTGRILPRKNLSPVLELLSAENTGRNTPTNASKSSEIAINPSTTRTFVQHSFNISSIQARLEASLMPYLLPRKRTTPLRRHSEVPRIPHLVPR